MKFDRRGIPTSEDLKKYKTPFLIQYFANFSGTPLDYFPAHSFLKVPVRLKLLRKYPSMQFDKQSKRKGDS